MAINKKATRKGNNQAPSVPPAKVKGVKKQRVSAQRAKAQKQTAGFPIVGIGDSAGGLAAFEALFSGMPIESETNMANVLVQHLAPDHKSILSKFIQRFTRLQVFEIEDGMTVQPNCVYIIPPGRDMAFLHGRLQLFEPLAAGACQPISFSAPWPRISMSRRYA